MTVNLLEKPASQLSPPFAATASHAREAWLTGFAGLIVVAFCGLLLAHDPQWFWADDYQSYQLANYRDVARAWHAGEGRTATALDNCIPVLREARRS